MRLSKFKRLWQTKSHYQYYLRSLIELVKGIGIVLLSFELHANTLTLDDMKSKNIIPIEQAQLAPLLTQKLINLSFPGNKKSSLSDFKGNVVLIDFWASWCGPCRESFPWMNKVMEKYKDQGFEVVAINLDQEAKLAGEFLNKVPANFTVLQDETGLMPEAYGLIGMPSSYLIDRSGFLRAVHIGFHSSKENDYEKAIVALIQEQEVINEAD